MHPSAAVPVLHATRGEHRWPSALAVAVAIVLQLLLPAPMVPQGRSPHGLASLGRRFAHAL